MAYDTNGLYRVVSGVVNIWVLDTVDAVATALAADYIDDAGPADSNVVAGKGMQIGDIVLIREITGSLREVHTVPAGITASQLAHVSAVDASTGAGSLTAAT